MTRASQPAGPQEATYEDVLAAPENTIAEVMDGVLYTQPRPAIRHAQSASTLGLLLGGPFQLGRGGPGGWVFIDEPELHFELGSNPGRSDIVVPDLAGWRVENFSEIPAEDEDIPFLTTRPDWLCEVHSPSTRGRDRLQKMALYRRVGVPWVWLIDPPQELLECYQLTEAGWLRHSAHQGTTEVGIAPFDVVPIDLSWLWLRPR